ARAPRGHAEPTPRAPLARPSTRKAPSSLVVPSAELPPKKRKGRASPYIRRAWSLAPPPSALQISRKEPAQLGVSRHPIPCILSLESPRVDTSEIVWGAAIVCASLVLSTAAVVLVIVRLPEHYFHLGERAPFWADRPTWQRWIGRIAKNVAGF